MAGVETVRCFWHGSPLSPYQLVGMRSFVDRGHRVELFTYDPAIAVPDWIVRRDANEIWPTDRILRYQKDLGRGSFALHANLFRYAMLHQLGGWWVDHDVVLLRPEFPAQDIFFSLEIRDPLTATFSVLKFPPGHPALAECVERCVALGESPHYGETGAELFSKVVVSHRLARHAVAMETTYPLSALDVPAMFDPAKSAELHKRCASATFLHLFNETWRRAGIPNFLGPPAGSFIDDLLRQYGLEARDPRMEVEHVRRWTAYLTLHEEFEAGQRAYRLANNKLKERVAALERENASLRGIGATLNNALRKGMDASLLRRSLRLFSRAIRR